MTFLTLISYGRAHGDWAEDPTGLVHGRGKGGAPRR
jgi:hypothetical protein